MDTGRKCDLFLRKVFSLFGDLLRLNTAAPEGHQGQISGCDNGQNVWTHANGLWEQELSQTRGTVQIHVREKSACSLCGAATGGRLNFVPIMTRIKAQNRVWENSRTPPLPLLLSNFPSTAQRVLSLYLSALSLDVSLKLLCFLSFSTPPDQRLKSASRCFWQWERERGRESTWDYKWLLNKHLKPQKSVTRTFYSFQVVKNTISRLSIWPCELLNAQASITITVI